MCVMKHLPCTVAWLIYFNHVEGNILPMEQEAQAHNAAETNRFARYIIIANFASELLAMWYGYTSYVQSDADSTPTGSKNKTM